MINLQPAESCIRIAQNADAQCLIKLITKV